MTLRILAACAALGTALAQPPVPNSQTGPRGPNRPSAPAAQGPAAPGPAMPGSDGQALRAYLNLSDAQMQEIRKAGEQARRQAQEKTRALEPQIREKHAALDATLAKGGDAATVGKLVLEIRALEKQMRDSHRAARDSFVNSLTPEQKTRFKAVEDAALLPQAARDAVRMGLVPGAAPRMQGRMQPRVGQGPNRGPNQGPRPGMQGPRGPMNQQQGPMPGQPGPGPNMMRRGQPGQPGQPQPPQPPQPPRPQEEEE
jgi:Spy/CpxP family protein refolding chaperone